MMNEFDNAISVEFPLMGEWWGQIHQGQKYQVMEQTNLDKHMLLTFCKSIGRKKKECF